MLSKDNLESIVRAFGLRLLLHAIHDTFGVRRHRDVRDALIHISCLAISIVVTSHLVDPIAERLSDAGRAVIFGLLVFYVVLRLATTARDNLVPA